MIALELPLTNSEWMCEIESKCVGGDGWFANLPSLVSSASICGLRYVGVITYRGGGSCKDLIEKKNKLMCCSKCELCLVL